MRHHFLPTLLIPCSTPLSYEDLPQHPTSIVRRISECVRRREGETGQSMKLKESGVVQSVQQEEQVQSPQLEERVVQSPQEEQVVQSPQEEQVKRSSQQEEQVKQPIQQEQLNHPPQQTDKKPLEYHFSECCNPATKIQAPEGVFPFSEAYSFTECLEDGSVANSAEDHQVYSFSSVCGVWIQSALSQICLTPSRRGTTSWRSVFTMSTRRIVEKRFHCRGCIMHRLSICMRRFVRWKRRWKMYCLSVSKYLSSIAFTR